MDGLVCGCGNPKCLVQLYWKRKGEKKGKYYEYRRDDQDYVFTYERAVDRAIEISSAIKKGEFRPEDYKDSNVRERRFECQIERWLNEKLRREALNELSPGTTGNYAGYVRNHYHFFDGVDVSDTREINSRMITLRDSLDKVKIKTRRHIFNALHNFFHWLKDDQEIIRDMPKFPVITGYDSKPSRAIDPPLQDEAIGKMPVAEAAEVIEFLCETGIRPAEGCALLCEDISVSGEFPSVMVTKGYKRGNIIKPTTKGKKSLPLPLSHRALEIAEKHLKDKLPKQFLFINPRTKRGYLPKAIWYQWRKYSGIEDITLYEGTRHSFGSQMIQNNDLTTVKELMGHSDIRTTQHYLHLKMRNLAHAVNSRKTPIRLVNRSAIEVGHEKE